MKIKGKIEVLFIYVLEVMISYLNKQAQKNTKRINIFHRKTNLITKRMISLVKLN